MDFDAIIVGAGVSGATAAILLAQSGWSVAVIEKREFPRRKVCGECIAATNFSLLDTLGVGPEVAALAGPPLKRVALYAGATELNAALPRLDESAHPFGRALGREHLDTLLLHRAEELGAVICQPWTVKQIIRHAGSYLCCARHTSTGESMNLLAPILISACGSWEPSACVRMRCQRSRGSDLFAFKANFVGATLDPGLLPVLAFPGGYGGMVIADHGKLTLAFCIRRDQMQKCRAMHPGVSAGEAMEAWLKQTCAGVRRATAGAHRQGAWLAVGPIRPGLRAPWQDRTGFAIGNAAGEAHPILGEGISMAMQSAWLLCELLNQHRAKLLTPRGQAVLGRAYARQWHAHFATRVRAAAVFAHLAMRAEAASGLLPVLRRWPELLTVAALVGGKVRRMNHSITATSARRINRSLTLPRVLR